MAASKNNQFWKLRSKHGRDILFSSPELLWLQHMSILIGVMKTPGTFTLKVKFGTGSMKPNREKSGMLPKFMRIRLSSSLSAVNGRIINARIPLVNRHNLSHQRRPTILKTREATPALPDRHPSTRL